MRHLSNEEKKIVKELYHYWEDNTYTLNNVFRSYFDYGKGAGFDLTTGELIIDRAKFKTVNDALNVQREIILIAKLIQYLEDIGYLYIIQDGSCVTPITYIGHTATSPIRVKVPIGVANVIVRTTNRVNLSQPLIDYVENGFKTYEDLTFKESKKQTAYALGALIVAIFALIVSIGSVQYDKYQKSQNNDVDVVVERINDFDNHISGELNQLVAGVNAIVESENSVAISNEKIVNYYYAPKKYSKKRKVTPQPTYISIDTISCEGKKYIVLPIK